MTSEVKLQVQELTETVELKYKTCRKDVNLTQDEACYHLDIKNVETLSRYENGRIIPPIGIVKKMAILYRNKYLVTWHLRYIYPEIAEYIPYPDEVNNIYEATLKFEFLAKAANNTMQIFKNYLQDGVFSEEEKLRLKECDAPEIKRVIDGLTAIVMYAEKI